MLIENLMVGYWCTQRAWAQWGHALGMAFCVIDLPNFWGPTQKIPNPGGAQKIGGRAPIGPPCPLSWQHSTRPLKMPPLAPPRVIIYSAHMAFCAPPRASHTK